MILKPIEKTAIIGDESRKSASSAIVRGAVGAAILGPVGLLAGASAKNKNYTTFLVLYQDGTKETMTVKNGSGDYKTLAKYLDI